MKRIFVAATVVLIVASFATPSSADTLIMRDGTRVQGRLVGAAAGTITFRRTDGTDRRYRTDDIEAVEFVSSARARSRGVSGGSIEAPAGTELSVRTVKAIDSRKADEFETFAAIVERPMRDASGRVVVPEGSRAQLIIRRLASSGARGDAEMVLDVESIAIDGRWYVVSTVDLEQENDTGIGTNRRTAATIGGGAALGTIIGAIAGGGRGAIIGGAVGAAGGAGVQILTNGRDVRVPAETVLTFKLDERMTLRPDR